MTDIVVQPTKKLTLKVENARITAKPAALATPASPQRHRFNDAEIALAFYCDVRQIRMSALLVGGGE